MYDIYTIVCVFFLVYFGDTGAQEAQEITYLPYEFVYDHVIASSSCFYVLPLLLYRIIGASSLSACDKSVSCFFRSSF